MTGSTTKDHKNVYCISNQFVDDIKFTDARRLIKTCANYHKMYLVVLIEAKLFRSRNERKKSM